jgi:hypothetical protein
MGTSPTVSKAEFYAAVFAVSVLLFVTGATLVFPILLLAKSPPLKSLVLEVGSASVALGVLIAPWLVDTFYKRAGLSRSGWAIEERSAPEAAPTDPFREVEPVIVRLNKSVSNVLTLMGLIATLLWLALTVCVALGPRRVEPGVVPAMLGLSVLCWSVLAGVYLMRFHEIARVDGQGVTGYGRQAPLRKKFVPWREVARCRILFKYDTFGNVSGVTPVFVGSDGEELLNLYVDGPAEDQERFLEALRTRFSKASVDRCEV